MIVIEGEAATNPIQSQHYSDNYYHDYNKNHSQHILQISELEIGSDPMNNPPAVLSSPDFEDDTNDIVEVDENEDEEEIFEEEANNSNQESDQSENLIIASKSPPLRYSNKKPTSTTSSIPRSVRLPIILDHQSNNNILISTTTTSTSTSISNSNNNTSTTTTTTTTTSDNSGWGLDISTPFKPIVIPQSTKPFWFGQEDKGNPYIRALSRFNPIE